jgi:hypothetical protein
MVRRPRGLVMPRLRQDVREGMRQWLVFLVVMVVVLTIGVGVSLERRNSDNPSRFQTVVPIDCPSMPSGGCA